MDEFENNRMEDFVNLGMESLKEERGYKSG